MELFILVGIIVSLFVTLFYFLRDNSETTEHHSEKSESLHQKPTKIYRRKPVNSFSSKKKIRVISVGGSGDNIVLKGILHRKTQYPQIDFITVNSVGGTNLDKTDWIIHITQAEFDNAVLLETKLNAILQNAEQLFLISGLGGNMDRVTQKIVELATQKNIFTLGIFTLPFLFEGKKRINQAEQMISTLSNEMELIIPIPSEKLLSEKRTLLEACLLMENLVSDIIETAVTEFERLSAEERQTHIPQKMMSIMEHYPIGNYIHINGKLVKK